MEHLRSRRTAARRAQAIERALGITPTAEANQRPARQTLP
jgi:DNA-binding transcriptional regulator YdaS (Cro superfamily)